MVYYLRELSRWFPVSVDYTLTVARQCDVVKNNKQFYYLTPLFVAIQFILIGFLLGFFGKSKLARVCGVMCEGYAQREGNFEGLEQSKHCVIFSL